MINNTYHELAKGNCKQESNARNTVADLAANKTQKIQVNGKTKSTYTLFRGGAGDAVRPTNFEDMNDSCEN